MLLQEIEPKGFLGFRFELTTAAKEEFRSLDTQNQMFTAANFTPPKFERFLRGAFSLLTDTQPNGSLDGHGIIASQLIGGYGGHSLTLEQSVFKTRAGYEAMWNVKFCLNYRDALWYGRVLSEFHLKMSTDDHTVICKPEGSWERYYTDRHYPNVTWSCKLLRRPINFEFIWAGDIK